MGELYGRKAILTIDTLQVTASDIEFSVTKTLKPSPNKADIKVLNLSPDHIAVIESSPTATVQLEVGYVSGTSVIFLGDLQTSLTVRNGNDSVTTLASADGGKKHRTARVQVSHKRGTPTATVLQSLVTALGVAPGNSAAAIGAIASAGFGDMFTLGTVLSGSAANEFTRILRAVGYSWSIQRGALQLLPVKQALAGTAIVLTPQSGLIGSPSVDKDGVMSCDCQIIPDIEPGRLVVVKSAHMQGQFRIEETAHAGATKGGNWQIGIKGKRY